MRNFTTYRRSSSSGGNELIHEASNRTLLSTYASPCKVHHTKRGNSKPHSAWDDCCVACCMSLWQRSYECIPRSRQTVMWHHHSRLPMPRGCCDNTRDVSPRLSRNILRLSSSFIHCAQQPFSSRMTTAQPVFQFQQTSTEYGMWLINTRSLALEEISDPASVDYAILSHTWENDEISFQDIRSPNANDVRQKAGFAKVAKTCELARQRHIDFAWVDTCCIDKSSSAELSEAINSMFTWYKLSTVCFVFLSNLPPVKDSESQPSSKGAFPYSQQTLGKCRCFTRGWTLQELIAPRHVEFFDSTWKRFSRKAECVEVLAGVTGILPIALEHCEVLRSIPVAVKMSWAAQRQTKRIEDRAYSLLGIFDINMPMIYGEGHKSFRRLQEEIAKETNDLSLFAWRGPPIGAKGYQEYRGSFARNMSEFLTCSNMWHSDARRNQQHEFSVTNKGVRIQAKLYKHTHGAYLMFLGVMMQEQDPVCILLRRTANGFIRHQPWSLEHTKTTKPDLGIQEILTFYIPKDVGPMECRTMTLDLHRSFQFFHDLSDGLEIDHMDPDPPHLWDSFYTTFINSDPRKSFAARLEILIHGKCYNFSAIYPLTLIVGWVQSRRRPFAVLHGTQTASDAENVCVRYILPKSFPGLTNQG